MKIETFILTCNEELLMPYIMRHYNQFSDVILLESHSTDRTKEIAHSMGAEIWCYNWPDEINDQIFLDVKNNCWKESRADWVIIVDADEFVWHPDPIKALSETNATIIIPNFYDMYSEVFPTTEGQIYDEVFMGKEQFIPAAKMNLFKPSEIFEMNYSPGCHEANPEGNILKANPGFKTLHMRYLGKQFAIDRNQRASRRRSVLNKEKNWGDHVDTPVDELSKRFDENIKLCIKVT